MNETMSGMEEESGESLYDILKDAKFQDIVKTNKAMAMLEKAGDVKKVTYIQAGELWFVTLCITLSILLAVFIYAILYNWKLYKKRSLYNKVLFKQDSVQIEGLASDDDDEEKEEEEEEEEQMTAEDRSGALRAVIGHILPTWACIMYMVSTSSLAVHCLLRVLYSYEYKLQDRTLPTVLQICFAAIAWVPSTCLPFIFTRCNKDHPADTTCLSSTGNVLLYRLQREGIWGLQVVSTVILVDDILVLVGVKSFDAVSQNGTSLTNLLYIWLGLFTVYIIVFCLLDWWINEEVLLLPYLLMLVTLCEIPTRNYRAMCEDAASLGSSGISLLILTSLSARLVYVWANKGVQSVAHIKFD